MKPTRIISSRVHIKAHHAQIYRFLDNLDNHKQILPGVRDWSGDKDTARYAQSFGLSSQKGESKIVERHVGLRVAEESGAGSGLRFRRYYKLQQDDQTTVCEISIVFLDGLSFAQKLLVAPFVKSALDATLANLKALMEKPKEAKAPAPAASAAAAAPAPAASPAAPSGPATAAAASAGE